MAVNCTSADVNGLPSCHLTPLRKLKVMVFPSGDDFHDVASMGSGPPLEFRSTSDSMIFDDTTDTPVEARHALLSVRCSSLICTVTLPPLLSTIGRESCRERGGS